MPKSATPWKDPRTATYYLKVEIPDDLKESFGKSWKKKSLRTKNHREALKLFGVEYARVLAEFEDFRSKASLSLKDAQILAARFDDAEKLRVDRAENWDEWLSIYPDKNSSPIAGKSAVPQELEGDGDLQFFLKHNDLWELARLEGETADQLVLQAGYRVNRQSHAYEELLRHVCHTRIQTEFHAMRRFHGDWSKAHASSISIENLSSEITPEESKTPSGPSKKGVNATSLKHLIADYIEHKTPTWGDSSKSAASLILNTFEQFIGGGVDPDLITREQIRKFKQLLSKLPLRYSNSEKFEGMSLIQIIDLADLENLNRLSEGAQYTKFTYVVGLFGFALLEERVLKNRAIGLNQKAQKSEEAVVYDSLELKAIFSHFNSKSDESRYWIPRIALCGFRQNEICQLKKSSFKEIDGITYIELGADIDVKNKNSHRRVPVPSWLIDIGLLDFARRSKGDELFSIRGPSYSRYYNREHKKILSRGNFHSFRHTFRAYCRRDGVDKEMAEYIGGWRSNEFSTGDQYGNDFKIYLIRLQSEINKLDYSCL